MTTCRSEKEEKKSKYNSRKQEYDGIVFDSVAEVEFYKLLVKMKEAGEVRRFILQPKFEVLPGFVNANGKQIRPIGYVADFHVFYPDGREDVIDIKGFQTPDFKLKKKLFEYTTGLPLVLLRYTKKGGFVDLEEHERERRARKRAKKKAEKP